MSQNIYYRTSDEKEVYLKHSGVTGMTWYNRRWQNEDGTWTEEGKERRRAEYARLTGASRGGWTSQKKKKDSNNSSKKQKNKGRNSEEDKKEAQNNKESNGEATAEQSKEKKNDFSGMSERAFKSGKDGKPSPAEKIGRETVNIVDKTGDIIDVIADINGRKRNAKIDLSSISDEELMKVVNRLGLEKRYIDAISKNEPDKTQKVKDFLAIVGGVAGIGLSIAGIFTAIHNIKGK